MSGTACLIIPHDIAVRGVHVLPPGPHPPGLPWEPLLMRTSPTTALYAITLQHPMRLPGVAAITAGFLVMCNVERGCTREQLTAYGTGQLRRVLGPYARRVFTHASEVIRV